MERPAYKYDAKTHETIYINKEAVVYSGCRSKEAHYQICDSICALSDNEVIILNQRYVIRVVYEGEHFTQEILYESKYRLYCVVAKEGYLAACGDNTLFVMDLSTKEILSKKLASTDKIYMEMNNSVDINVHCGETRLVLADNSGLITVFRLPSLDRVAELPHGDAINNAKFSPNGQYLAAVGDECKMYLYSIGDKSELASDTYEVLNMNTSVTDHHRSGLNGQYTKEKDITVGNDVYVNPQYCCWSSDSNTILVSHEDNQSLVFKASTLDVIKKIDLIGSLAVATSPISSLAVYCNRNKLYILDLLEPSEKHQIIYIAHYSHGSINGIRFSPSGKKLFVVTPKGLHILDVVAVDSLRTSCIKSMGQIKLKESIDLGLAPRELYIEPYKPVDSDEMKEEHANQEQATSEQDPIVFKVHLCGTISEIKEVYGSSYNTFDFDHGLAFDGSDYDGADPSADDMDDDGSEYTDDDAVMDDADDD